MQPSKYLALILINFIIDFQCTPIPQSGSAHNPERNEELGGSDIVPPPLTESTIGRGVAIRPGWYHRWSGGVIPYEFASNITASNVNFIVQQMRAMENLTAVNHTQCIQFRAKNATDPYFITIFNGSGCSAPVGSWGSYTGVRPVSLMDATYSTCMISGIVQHELTHVLGFYHEQSRPDRDSYVSIQWANIDPSQAFNFDKYNDTDVDTQMTSYDYGSVMHYEWNAFALNSSAPTILTILNATAFIGQRIQLSPIDIIEIQRYYNCVATPTTTGSTTSTSAMTNGTSVVTTTNSGNSSTTFVSSASNNSTVVSTSGTNGIGSTRSTTGQTTARTPDAKTIGLVVGISVGVLLTIIIIGLVSAVIIRKCKKKSSTTKVESHKTTSRPIHKQPRTKHQVRTSKH